MIGLFLVLVAALFIEIADSTGKYEINQKKESIYTFGFLVMLWGTIFLFALAFIRDSFIFSTDSIPTLSIRIILEIVQMHVAILALAIADRSTIGFLRIVTIPLLLFVDLFLGYSIGTYAFWGISVITGALVLLFINHGIKKNGAGLVLFGGVNAVATISLYKYNITHFNSVEVEQGIVHVVLLVYLFIMAILIAKENPLSFLKKPLFFWQSIFAGIGTVLISFAYLFGAASVITTIKRAASIMWAMVSGNAYFQEKHLAIKLTSFLFILIGLWLLTI